MKSQCHCCLIISINQMMCFLPYSSAYVDLTHDTKLIEEKQGLSQKMYQSSELVATTSVKPLRALEIEQLASSSSSSTKIQIWDCLHHRPIVATNKRFV